MTACTCFFDDIRIEIDKFRREGSLIFKGKLIFKGNDSTIKNRFGLYPIVNIFQIQKSWTGIDTSIEYIRLYEDQSSCGYRFKQDSIYLIYAREIEHRELNLPAYFTSICMPTKLWSKSKPDSLILGAGLNHGQSFKEIVVNEKQGVKSNYFTLLVVSFILNLFLLVLLFWKKNNV